jgi:hypothetical protein
MTDDPTLLTPEERRRQLAALLAAGLRRWLARPISPPAETLENLSPGPTSAAALTPEKSVTVHTG